MATQPLPDTVLNDTSGFTDSTPTPTSAPAPAETGDAGDQGDDALQLTDDQALDDSLAKPDDADAGDEGGDKPDKTENPVEKRIKGALKARDDARNALENERAAKAELEQRLRALEAKLTPENSGEAAADAPAPPNPGDFDLGVLDAAYQDKLADYKAEIKVKEALGNIESKFQEQQQQRAAAAAHEKTLEDAKNIVAKGVALHDDFEEVVWERGQRQEYPLDVPTFEALREAENAAEIVYALASDVDEAKRVAAMTPIQQVKYVLEKDKELSAKPARVTKAAPPPGNQTRGASGRFQTPPDTEDLDAFEKEFFSKKR